MDAFYASVVQRDNSAFRGLPLAVGFDGERGVVSTASYEARRYSVHSAQPVVVAKRLCPSLIIVPPRFHIYKEVSEFVLYKNTLLFHNYSLPLRVLFHRTSAYWPNEVLEN